MCHPVGFGKKCAKPVGSTKGNSPYFIGPLLCFVAWVPILVYRFSMRDAASRPVDRQRKDRGDDFSEHTMVPMDDRRLLALIGNALYGDHWKTPVARKIGIADRTMRRWLQTGEIPEWVWGEFDVVIRDRAEELGLAAERLREKISETD